MTEHEASTATIRCSQCGLSAEVTLEPWTDFDVILQKLELASCEHLRELFAYALAGGSDPASHYEEIDLDGALQGFMEEPDEDHNVPLKEAAEMLGVSVKTLKRWLESGLIRPDEMWQRLNGRWYVEKSAIRRIVARRAP